MKYDVWCMQDHRYVVTFAPLGHAEERAEELSRAMTDLDYFVVKQDDTPVIHYKAGRRTELNSGVIVAEAVPVEAVVG